MAVLGKMYPDQWTDEQLAPYKLGNIIGGLGRRLLQADGSAESGILNPQIPQDTQVPGGIVSQSPPAMTPSHSLVSTIPQTSGLRAPGSGFIVTSDGRVIKDYGNSSVPAEANTGLTHMVDAGLTSPGGGSTGGGGGAPMSTMLDRIDKNQYFAPDNTDQSMGGTFARGLRMKQDRTYAGIDNLGIQNQLENQKQSIAAQGQDHNAQLQAQQNQTVAARFGSLNAETAAQTVALNMGINKQRRVDALTTQYLAEKDPAQQKLLHDQIQLIIGVREPPAQPHFGTETNADMTTSPYAIVKQADGSLKYVPKAGMMTPEARVQDAAKGLSAKQLESVRKTFASRTDVSPEEVLAAIAGLKKK